MDENKWNYEWNKRKVAKFSRMVILLLHSYIPLLQNKATVANLENETTSEFLNYELIISVTEFNYWKLNTYKNLG